jgi:hypothetical protein
MMGLPRGEVTQWLEANTFPKTDVDEIVRKLAAQDRREKPKSR